MGQWRSYHAAARGGSSVPAGPGQPAQALRCTLSNRSPVPFAGHRWPSELTRAAAGEEPFSALPPAGAGESFCDNLGTSGCVFPWLPQAIPMLTVIQSYSHNTGIVLPSGLQ